MISNDQIRGALLDMRDEPTSEAYERAVAMAGTAVDAGRESSSKRQRLRAPRWLIAFTAVSLVGGSTALALNSDDHPGGGGGEAPPAVINAQMTLLQAIHDCTDAGGSVEDCTASIALEERQAKP